MLKLYNTLISMLWPLLYLYPPFRGTMEKRLGDIDLMSYDPDHGGLKVLINAVSAGEVVAITPFIEQLKKVRPESRIVLLTTTESGQTMAKDKLGDLVDCLAYFPLIDLPFVVGRYLSKLKPHMYITTEAEIWPNIQRMCQAEGIPVALVNARIYLHNKKGLRKKIVRDLYESIDLIVCQDELHFENFKIFGIDEKRLRVSGNTKFDFTVEEWDVERLTSEKARLGLDGELVLVAGSTHPKEEEIVLEVFKQVREQISRDARLVLAPRHIERASDVAKLAKEQDYIVETLSGKTEQEPLDVLIVDSYGVLLDMYRQADIVIMGGTFHKKVGGHNILEATVLGKPVIIGPYNYSITAQKQMLEKDEAILVVEDKEGLCRKVMRLASDQELRHKIGDKAHEITLKNRGSAKRSVAYVMSLINV